MVNPYKIKKEVFFMNARTFLNYMNIRISGRTTFYASDFGLNGGEINGLVVNGLIRPTGQTKNVMIPIDWNIYKKVSAKEWVVEENGFNYWQANDFVKVLHLFVKNIPAIESFLHRCPIEEDAVNALFSYEEGIRCGERLYRKVDSDKLFVE